MASDDQFIRDAKRLVSRLSEHLGRMGAPSPVERELLSEIRVMLGDLKARLADMKRKSGSWTPGSG